MSIPDNTEALIAGFNHEYINYMLGGRFRASYRPLNDAIIDGRIRGVVGVVGCNNPRVKHDDVHVRVVRELIANGCLVVMTGCAAQSVAKAGLMLPEVAREICPQGLWEVCEAVGIPPVLHVRLLRGQQPHPHRPHRHGQRGRAGRRHQRPPGGRLRPGVDEREGHLHRPVLRGLGRLHRLRREVADHGQRGRDRPTSSTGTTSIYGNAWDFEPDPEKMVGKLLSAIDDKREALGIAAKRERVLFDMAMRRELEV